MLTRVRAVEGTEQLLPLVDLEEIVPADAPVSLGSQEARVARAHQSFTGADWSLTLSIDPSALKLLVSEEENDDIKLTVGFASAAGALCGGTGARVSYGAAVC